MLFNSTSFLLLFLPASVAGFYLSRRVGLEEAAIAWLIAMSIFFYALWDPAQIHVPFLSALFNIGIVFAIRRLPDGECGLARVLLYAGVVGNVALLFYFKAQVSPWFSNRAPGGFSVATDILIPLGISFITFRQITFLVDGYRDRFANWRLRDYLFYLFFFPQQIMGPLVRYDDIAGQLRGLNARHAAWDDLASGVAIFALGLFKKVWLADQLALFPDRVFASAATGTPISFAHAWLAAPMLLFQIYFDFSGYADMAIGAARMFGINLPVNFDAPFRAIDRFDFWRRWHISFASFMRQYVFTPLVRRVRLPALPALLATALLSGLWHGLSPTFVVWSVAQVSLLMASHLYRSWARTRTGLKSPWVIRLNVIITLALSAMLTIVFRASDLQAAWTIYAAMLGQNDVGASAAIAASATARALLTLAGAMFIMWCLPTTQHFFSSMWTATDARGPRDRPPPAEGWWLFRPQFRLNGSWAVFIALLLAASLMGLGRTSRFVYFQF